MIPGRGRTEKRLGEEMATSSPKVCCTMFATSKHREPSFRSDTYQHVITDHYMQSTTYSVAGYALPWVETTRSCSLWIASLCRPALSLCWARCDGILQQSSASIYRSSKFIVLQRITLARLYDFV